MKVIIQYLKEYKIMGYEPPGTPTLIVVVLENGVMEYHLRCFKCGFAASLSNHKVIVTEEKVTLTPSVLCPVEKCKAHYYIRDGLIEDC